MAGDRNIFVRLSVRDAEKATAALRRFGRDGRGALQAIERASQPASRGLRSVDQAARGVRGTLDKVSRGVRTLRGAMAALAAGLAVRELTQFSLRALDLADQIDKVAARADIGRDSLQALRLEAAKAGVDTGRLNTGLEAFAKRLGEARTGTGRLSTLLNEMDASFRQQVLGAQSAEEALQAVLDRMASMEDQADRAALASAAFSRTAGTQMSLLVREGAISIAELTARAREAGAVMGGDVIDSAVAAKDRLTELGQTSKATFNASFISEFAQEFGKLADEVNSERLQGGIEAIGSGLGSAAADAARLVSLMGTAADKIAELKQSDGLGSTLFDLSSLGIVLNIRDFAKNLISEEDVNQVERLAAAVVDAQNNRCVLVVELARIAP